MFVEYKNVKQHDDDYPRRWFGDDFFDLIVWYDGRKEICGFQLCYDKTGTERALTWLARSGFKHQKIDTGEYSVMEMRTPSLTPEVGFPAAEVSTRFIESSQQIEPGIVNLVVAKLDEYAAHNNASQQK